MKLNSDKKRPVLRPRRNPDLIALHVDKSFNMKKILENDLAWTTVKKKRV